MRSKSSGTRRQRRGAMMVLILVLLAGFLATVAFSIDIAYMHLTRTELRSATDAAAQAASQELSLTFDRDKAIAKGKEIAGDNLVAGDRLLLADSDFQFGRSDYDSVSGSFEFIADATPQNTVRVTGRRTANSPSGSVPLFFGNLFGFSHFEPRMNSAATYIERDVVLVVDRSGSMNGAKFEDLQSAIDVFIATLDGTPVEEEVGLASYNATASEDVLLTKHLQEIRLGLEELQTGGYTSISNGMSAGANIMSHSRSADFVERTMIVMTDGLHNRGPEPSTVASELVADHVQIHTITFGEGADVERMKEVATIGGGRHFHALNAEELREAYREIALTLGTLITE